MNGADAVAIIDKMLEAERALQRARDAVAKLQKLRDRVTIKRCGDCFLWMKSRQCPREKNVNGYSRGPSCKALACASFRPDKSYQQAVADLELAEQRAREQGAQLRLVGEG